MELELEALEDPFDLAPAPHRRGYPGLDPSLPPGGALAGRLISRILGDSLDDPPLAPGIRVGGWRIGALIGCGGSSMVYVAHRDDGHFDQQAALKIVRPNPLLVAQFRRERQILARLRHPAIARLIDGGSFEGGRLWFAMELVFGQRIDHHARSRRTPISERLRLFETLCDAVVHAHERQLVHRDIKPGNVLVDENGHARLLDFGIASSDEEDDAAGLRAMTPIYASPEQHGGGATTAASDIYQLGVLLGVLLVPDGAPCATLPRRPRTIVRREIDAVIARATAAAPSERYPSAAALRADIAALRQRRPLSVFGGSGYKAARLIERHAVAFAIACVAIVALVTLAMVASWRIGIERDRAREAAHARLLPDVRYARTLAAMPACAPEKERPPHHGGLCRH